jgi:protein TonB
MNKKQKFIRYLPLMVGVVLAIVIAIVIYWMQGLFEKPAQTKKQIQQISIVQPPPPPPPPPEIKPPPPPEVKEEKIEEPEPEPETPEPEAPPAGEDLGVDAEGGAGGDSFGLVGKKGGRGLIGGGGGGNAFIFYGQQMQREVSDALQRSLGDAARAKKYSVIASLWISPNGALSRAELNGGSGDAAVDAALREALASLRLHLQAPPPGMPQPVKIRIRS